MTACLGARGCGPRSLAWRRRGGRRARNPETISASLPRQTPCILSAAFVARLLRRWRRQVPMELRAATAEAAVPGSGLPGLRPAASDRREHVAVFLTGLQLPSRPLQARSPSEGHSRHDHQNHERFSSRTSVRSATARARSTRSVRASSSASGSTRRPCTGFRRILPTSSSVGGAVASAPSPPVSSPMTTSSNGGSGSAAPSARRRARSPQSSSCRSGARSPTTPARSAASGPRSARTGKAASRPSARSLRRPASVRPQ